MRFQGSPDRSARRKDTARRQEPGSESWPRLGLRLCGRRLRPAPAPGRAARRGSGHSPAAPSGPAGHPGSHAGPLPLPGGGHRAARPPALMGPSAERLQDRRPSHWGLRGREGGVGASSTAGPGPRPGAPSAPPCTADAHPVPRAECGDPRPPVCLFTSSPERLLYAGFQSERAEERGREGNVDVRATVTGRLPHRHGPAGPPPPTRKLPWGWELRGGRGCGGGLGGAAQAGRRARGGRPT